MTTAQEEVVGAALTLQRLTAREFASWQGADKARDSSNVAPGSVWVEASSLRRFCASTASGKIVVCVHHVGSLQSSLLVLSCSFRVTGREANR